MIYGHNCWTDREWLFGDMTMTSGQLVDTSIRKRRWTWHRHPLPPPVKHSGRICRCGGRRSSHQPAASPALQPHLPTPPRVALASLISCAGSVTLPAGGAAGQSMANAPANKHKLVYYLATGWLPPPASVTVALCGGMSAGSIWSCYCVVEKCCSILHY